MDRIEIYQGRGRVGRKQWRWRYVAAGNSARLAHGGESYQNYSDCLAAMSRVTGVAVADVGGRVVHPHSDIQVHRSIGQTLLVTVKR